MNVFRLLIFAIFAVLLIAIATLLFPQLPKENESQLIARTFKEAEIAQGKYVSRKIEFNEGYYVKGNAFDTPSRSIAFNCIDLDKCCDKEMLSKLCTKPVQWGSRFLRITKKIDLEFSARCREDEFFICKGFIAKEPGQIEITSYSIQPTRLLKGQKITARAKLRNSGKTDIIEVKGSLTLFREIKTEKGITKKEERKIYFERFPLLLGQDVQLEKEVEIEKPGEYEAELYFEESTDMTDFAKKTERIIVENEISQGNCLRGSKEYVWDSNNEKCTLQLECLDCIDMKKCIQSWTKAIPELVGKKFEQTGFNTTEKRIKISVDGRVQGTECIPT